MTLLGLLARWAHLASGATLFGTFALLLLAGRARTASAGRWNREALALARAAVVVARLVVVAAVVGCVSVSVVVVACTRPSEYWPRCQYVKVGYRSGAGKLFAASLPTAACMNSCQIVAGNVPPATEMPCTFSIGISAFG